MADEKGGGKNRLGKFSPKRCSSMADGWNTFRADEKVCLSWMEGEFWGEEKVWAHMRGEERQNQDRQN